MELVLLQIFPNIIAGFTTSPFNNVLTGFLFSGNIRGKMLKAIYKMLKREHLGRLSQSEFLPAWRHKIVFVCVLMCVCAEVCVC